MNRTKKAMPWLLILGGFFTLNMLPIFVGGACIIAGLVMIIEQLWPEKWDIEA